MTTSIFEFEDYRDFLKAWIRSHSENRGLKARLSEAGGVHKTTLSQIFSGAKDLSAEQVVSMAGLLGLGAAEVDFFLLLLQRSRAGSAELKRVIDRQIEAQRKNRQKLMNRVTRSRELSSEESAI